MKNKRSIFTLLIAFMYIIMVSCTSQNNNEQSLGCELYRIQVGDKYGFMDEYGNIIIEAQYDEAHSFFKGNLCCAVIGEREGLINRDGEFVVEFNSDINWVYPFTKGLARCNTLDRKFGVLDKNGAFILPAIYKDITRGYEDQGFIIEDTLGKKGYVNCKGEFIIPCKYDKVYGFCEDLAIVAINNKWGYMDTLGNWAIDTIYDEARIFGNGLARVKKDGKWMFINHKGNTVESLRYDSILTGFANNRAFVMLNDKILLIDNKGKTIKQIEADFVTNYKEGFATFGKEGKFGKLDTLGNIVIPAIYDELNNFEEGFARFELNNKYGIIDSTGNVVVLAEHNDNAGKFKGLSLLYGRDYNQGNYRMTYYDKEGNVIWKDMPGNKFLWPAEPTKEDYIAFFDSKLSELDPIEGVYYVTFNDVAVDRDNDHVSSNGTYSRFYAVIRNRDNSDEFYAYVIDKDKPFHRWVKKFVQIGESNTYAIVNREKESTWSEDGKLILEDPYNFEVTLRTGGNNYYNWYVQCEFTKDYPTTTEYEQVQKAEWSGTGFAIADGFVVTNYHVIQGAKTIYIKSVNGDKEDRYKGFVVASDKQNDLAILRVVDKDFKGFEEIPYCIGKTISEVGDEVFVLGYPLTKTMGDDVKLTNGIISSATGYKGDEAMYQISVPLQPGNSGGPLFDNDGNVIGVVCAKHSNAENANYAIKVSYLYSLVNGSGLGIKMADSNKVKGNSLSQKVKQVKPFVYLIECRSH